MTALEDWSIGMSVFKTAALTILLCAASAYVPAAWAQQNAAPANPPAGVAPGPAVQPKAIELINAMGAKLDAAKSMSFSARTAFEEPARNGQPLFYMVQASVAVGAPGQNEDRHFGRWAAVRVSL